jgi:hypothetical protein
MVIKLENCIEGTASTKGFTYLQKYESDKGYVYEVMFNNTPRHYEVFLKKTTPICLDFENRIYSETDFKETYPKDNDFGKWAWTKNNYEEALEKLTTYNNE